VKDLFGEEIFNIVDGVTKLSKFSASNTLSQEEKQAENFRKMIIAMAQRHSRHSREARRPHAQHAHARSSCAKTSSSASRKRPSTSTRRSRTAWASSWIKTELEDLAFQYLKPVEFKELTEKNLPPQERAREVHRRRHPAHRREAERPQLPAALPLQAPLQHSQEDEGASIEFEQCPTSSPFASS